MPGIMSLKLFVLKVKESSSLLDETVSLSSLGVDGDGVSASEVPSVRCRLFEVTSLETIEELSAKEILVGKRSGSAAFISLHAIACGLFATGTGLLRVIEQQVSPSHSTFSKHLRSLESPNTRQLYVCLSMSDSRVVFGGALSPILSLWVW